MMKHTGEPAYIATEENPPNCADSSGRRTYWEQYTQITTEWENWILLKKTSVYMEGTVRLFPPPQILSWSEALNRRMFSKNAQ